MTIKHIGVVAWVLITLTGYNRAVAAAASPHYTDKLVHAWWQIAKAYVIDHDVDIIDRFANSENLYLRHFARSLRSEGNGHFKKAADEATKCISLPTVSAGENYMHMVCLLAKARANGDAYRTKQYYNYMYAAFRYALRYRKQIESVYNKAYLDGFLALYNRRFDPSILQNTTIAVSKHWKVIPFDEHGLIRVDIDGVIVPMIIDTGSNGITLTRADIVKYGLSTRLKQIGLEQTVAGIGGPEDKQSVALVESLRFGPMRIHNAYVSVSAKGGAAASFIGLNVLSRLGSFAYTQRGLVHHVDRRRFRCTPMVRRVYALGQSSDWAILVPLRLSFGQALYFLDTGFAVRGHGPALLIYPNYAKMLINSGRAEGVHDAYGVNTFNGMGGRGTQVGVMRIRFHVNDASVPSSVGRAFTADVLPEGFHNRHYFYGDAGVVGRNTLRALRLTLQLDFGRSQVCERFTRSHVHRGK